MDVGEREPKLAGSTLLLVPTGIHPPLSDDDRSSSWNKMQSQHCRLTTRKQWVRSLGLSARRPHVVSRRSSLFPRSKHMHVRLIRNSKLALGGKCELLSVLLCGPATMRRLIQGANPGLARRQPGWCSRKSQRPPEHMAQRGRKTNIRTSE